jgi:hypothetical protein
MNYGTIVPKRLNEPHNRHNRNADERYFRTQRKHEVFCRGGSLRISLNARHADGTAVALRACALVDGVPICEDVALPRTALDNLEALAEWADASPGTSWVVRIKRLPEFRTTALAWFKDDPQLPYTRTDLSTGSVWLRAALPEGFGVHRHGLNPDGSSKGVA